MARFTQNQGLKLKLPKVWYVGVVSKRMKNTVYFFDNKAEAKKYYMNRVANHSYFVSFEEWNLNLKKGYYNMKTLDEYRSPENRKHLWGE